MGGRGGNASNLDKKGYGGGHLTETAFRAEASRQGIDADRLTYELEDYVTSSYGGISLGDKITDFIENCPENLRYKGTIYRGLYFEDESGFNSFLGQHTEGSTLKARRDGLSWSASEGVAKEFASGGDYSVILVNEDKKKTAVGIKNIADTPISSEEVLYSNRRDFRVKSVKRKGRTAYVYVSEKRGR